MDSDNAANELCDLVEDIVERVPYLRVLVSMLMPRFDLQVSSITTFSIFLYFSSDLSCALSQVCTLIRRYSLGLEPPVLNLR